jgi:flagellar biosynthesis/type III secretory pathway protein FliH
MDEKKTRRRRFEDEIPEEVRQHARAAREELRESVKAFLPPGFVEHRKKARKEMLLAWRSLIDSAIERIDQTNDEETV